MGSNTAILLRSIFLLSWLKKKKTSSLHNGGHQCGFKSVLKLKQLLVFYLELLKVVKEDRHTLTASSVKEYNFSQLH